MAQFHQYCLQVNMQHKGIRSHEWLEQLVATASPLLSTEDAAAIALTLAQFRQLKQQNLPIGLTHSDLFRDNALFEGNKLNGIIDFYSASEAYLLLDLAILINDWCRDGEHINIEKRCSVISAYNEHRTLTQPEHEALDVMQKVAAMRFWLSRILQQQKEGQKSLGIKKAPEEYRRLFYNL
jgi:homoserine kinase type II